MTNIATLAQLFPAPLCPKTKLSGLKICPNGPDRTESMVPGSRSTRTARGTYLPPERDGRIFTCSSIQHNCNKAYSVRFYLAVISIEVFLTSSLIVVHVDSLELKIGVTVVGASWVDTVLIGDDLPELKDKEEASDKINCTLLSIDTVIGYLLRPTNLGSGANNLS